MKLSSQIRFLPWIGSQYYNGFNGVRTLILGESHYQKNGKDYSRNLNIELITGQADKTGPYTGRYPFWTKIVKLVSPDNIDPHRFWHSVAYYNYIQEFVVQIARMRPSDKMWKDAKEPFYEILQALRPDFILVLGNNLWNFLPSDNCADIENKPNSLYCIYSIDGHPTIATKIRHPSSFGFKYADWYPIVEDGINLAIKQKRGDGRS